MICMLTAVQNLSWSVTQGILLAIMLLIVNKPGFGFGLSKTCFGQDGAQN